MRLPRYQLSMRVKCLLECPGSLVPVIYPQFINSTSAALLNLQHTAFVLSVCKQTLLTLVIHMRNWCAHTNKRKRPYWSEEKNKGKKNNQIWWKQNSSHSASSAGYVLFNLRPEENAFQYWNDSKHTVDHATTIHIVTSRLNNGVLLTVFGFRDKACLLVSIVAPFPPKQVHVRFITQCFFLFFSTCAFINASYVFLPIFMNGN